MDKHASNSNAMDRGVTLPQAYMGETIALRLIWDVCQVRTVYQGWTVLLGPKVMLRDKPVKQGSLAAILYGEQTPMEC